MSLNKTIGRNEPCPCGSGRKYKRCCLAEDERRAAQERKPVSQADEHEDAPAFAKAPDIHQIPAMLQQLASKSSSKEDRSGFEDLLARTKPILEYVERQPAIEEAGKALEAHRAEFEKLSKNPDAYQKRAQALFGEERFAPLRFTAEDLRRAFDKVGVPVQGGSNDQFVKTLRKAILHVADKERRNHAAMSMLMHLPEYVAAKRHLDGWIIQECAYLTQEETDTSNAFLFQMFSYGYDAWMEEQRGRQAAMLSELGMDVPRLKGMSMEEIEAWLEAQEADPAQRARMEKLLQAHPEERAQAEANLRQLENDAHNLLQREDAAHLLLSPGEVQPWLPRMLEIWEGVLARFPDLTTPSPSPAAGSALMDGLVPLLREMVAKLFTPERLGQLAAQLKAYRNERFAAGDKRTAELANGAMIYVKDEDEPDCNRFLCILGYHSLLEGAEGL